MDRSPYSPDGAFSPQQVMAARLVWFGQTIASTLIVGAMMLFTVPGMGLALPPLRFASREAQLGGVVVLGIACFLGAKSLRQRLYAPPLAGVALANADPAQRALATLNANSAVVGGLLTLPFMVAVALFFLDHDPWLFAAGAWAPLLGGVALGPDPQRAYRELVGRGIDSAVSPRA